MADDISESLARDVQQLGFLFRQRLMAKSEVLLLVADLDATVGRTIGGLLDADLP